MNLEKVESTEVQITLYCGICFLFATVNTKTSIQY